MSLQQLLIVGCVFVWHVIKVFRKKKIPCQAVCNKLEVEAAPKVLQDLRRLEKGLISRRILFKKVAIMHGKGEFSKIKGNICNVPIETQSVCNVLPKPVNNNGLIIVKLKCHLRYRGQVYFEPVWLESIYAALNYLKNNNKFYEDISVLYDLSSNEILNAVDASFAHEQTCNNHPDTQIENKLNFELLDDPLNLHRVAANETTLISEIPGIIDEDNITIAPGQGKTLLSIVRDDYCEELAFPYLLPTGKFGYKVKREVSFSPVKYFNQRLLNFKQTFASDADFIFFARSIVE